MIIGLLMNAHEDDVLQAVMDTNAPLVDGFYALDGTTPNTESRKVIESYANCWGYTHDTTQPRDGSRALLLEQAYAEHGPDHWFVILHGDEVWTTTPAAMIERYGHLGEALMLRLPMYFPTDWEGWEDEVPPLEQLKWHLGPGYPEARIFRGGVGVTYDPAQHFRCVPHQTKRFVDAPDVIKHYPYRAPQVQVERAQRHRRTGFDPDNYRHILDDGSGTLWTNDTIESKLIPGAYDYVAVDA